MSYDMKFACFCFSLEKRCLILGFITFFLSVGMVATSIAILVARRTSPDCCYEYLTSISDKALDILLPTIIVLGVLWMGFSVLLGLGIWKNLPSFVLSYFTFSTMLTIVLLLGALLLLLESWWTVSLAMFLFSIVHIYSIVMVHTTYDTMQIRRGFYERQRSESQAILVDDEE